MKTFLDRLRHLMDLHGMGENQYQLAKATGIGYTTVNTWFTKGSLPNRQNIRHLADHFGVSAAWLEHGEDTTAPTAPTVAEGQKTFTVRVDIHKEIAQHNARVLRGIVARLVRIFEEGDYRKTGAVINLITVLDPKQEEG